ncbi:MAG: electron transport complex subunit RsxG [Gammaproteobacteria bacterium]|nr:MAG: electron transport complex subunit RsxG [Gammaproteobacteria bacterium]
MLFQSISKNSVILAIFAIVTSGLVAFTSSSTETLRAEAKQRALEKALSQIISADQYSNDLLANRISISDPLLGLTRSKDAYLAWKDGQPYAAILPAIAPEGYGGALEMIIGIHYDGTLAGVRIVPPHNETPGLGDKVDIKKSPWVLGFNGHSLQNPHAKGWKVKKDGGQFDQFTGATITPRAVVKGVHRALQYFKVNKDALFSNATPVPRSTNNGR